MCPRDAPATMLLQGELALRPSLPSLAALLLLPVAVAAVGGASPAHGGALWPEVSDAQTPELDQRDMQVSWSMRGAWLVQENARRCFGIAEEPCRTEHVHALLLMITLSVVLVSVMCAFAFFREDKEEQITPLCPQLVVRDGDLDFHMPLDAQPLLHGVAETMVVTRRSDDALVCKVALDWPDPFRLGASGVAATVRVSSSKDHNLATVVARNVAMVGQGLALCRAGPEIFGFVEPEGPQRYYVRHRTGVHLLTLVGEFGSNMDIEGINPVGSRVFWFKKTADGANGSILQHFDAGLVISSILAAYVHRRLTVPVPAAALPAAEAAPAGPGPEQRDEPSDDQAELGVAEARAVVEVFPPATAGSTPRSTPRTEGADATAEEQPGGTTPEEAASEPSPPRFSGGLEPSPSLASPSSPSDEELARPPPAA